MPLSLDPEYFKAIEPLLPALANAPKLAIGDIQGRRTALDNIIGALVAQVPETTDVKESTYQVKSSDGHAVPLHHYAKHGTATSTSSPGPAVYYLHGGGFICMDVEIYRTRLKNLVSDTGVQIFAPDYQLSPEVHYPVALEEAWAGLRHLVENASTYGVDPARIAVMGDSAGGGLAACLALKARDESLSPPLAKQILVYPMLDNTNIKPITALEPFLTWTYDDNITGWGAYLGDGVEKGVVPQYAAAARAATVAGLPPTYMDLGELDIFRDEDLEYARRLAAENITTELHVYPGVPHAFEVFASDSSVAKQAWANRMKAMKSF